MSSVADVNESEKRGILQFANLTQFIRSF